MSSSQRSSRPAALASLIGLTLLTGLVQAGCGRPEAPPDASSSPGPAADPDASSAAGQVDTEPPPRPRSEPPPRPPLPSGIARFDKDVITLSLSGDGRYLAGGDLAGKSLLWDLPSGRFLWGDPTPVGNRIGRVVFAETGDVWVGGSFDEPDRPWRAWSADALERRGEFGTPGEVAIDLALDRKGETAVVLTSSPNGTQQVVSAWKLAADRPHFSTTAFGSRRGSVAISPDGLDIAVSDDRGGLLRFDLRAGGRRVALAEPGPDAVPDRIARLAFVTADEGVTAEPGQLGLWAASKARLTRYPPPRLDPAGGEPAPAAPTTVTLADAAHPIRGLHRVGPIDGASSPLVAVTRPEAGGLTFWGLDGQVIGELVTDCRCETHALAHNGKVAACGCAPASEIRYGAPTWRAR